MKEQLDRIEAKVDRLEAKLDALIDALTEESDEEEEGFDLEGNPMGRERDPGDSLD